MVIFHRNHDCEQQFVRNLCGISGEMEYKSACTILNCKCGIKLPGLSQEKGVISHMHKCEKCSLLAVQVFIIKHVEHILGRLLQGRRNHGVSTAFISSCVFCVTGGYRLKMDFVVFRSHLPRSYGLEYFVYL